MEDRFQGIVRNSSHEDVVRLHGSTEEEQF